MNFYVGQAASSKQQPEGKSDQQSLPEESQQQTQQEQHGSTQMQSTVSPFSLPQASAHHYPLDNEPSEQHPPLPIPQASAHHYPQDNEPSEQHPPLPLPQTSAHHYPLDNEPSEQHSPLPLPQASAHHYPLDNEPSEQHPPLLIPQASAHHYPQDNEPSEQHPPLPIPQASAHDYPQDNEPSEQHSPLPIPQVSAHHYPQDNEPSEKQSGQPQTISPIEQQIGSQPRHLEGPETKPLVVEMVEQGEPNTPGYEHREMPKQETPSGTEYPPGESFQQQSTTSQCVSKTIDYSIQLEPEHQVRKYQWELAMPGIQGENYIICAPTGTGKTLVAALVISDHLQKRRGKGKVIFMVDKKPLARQQADALKKLIPQANVNCSTGDNIGFTIKLLLPNSDIIVCTAGKLLNELSESHVGFNEISLVIIDECHHTQKESPHARVMEKYLEKKQRDKRPMLPQVIGLTASPGAGDNPTLEKDVTVKHLISLCALMDATSGITTVTKNKAELEQHTNKPVFTLSVLKCRDTEEAFVKCVTSEMAILEQSVVLRCTFKRWSQEYETSIQQKKKELEDSPNPDDRDQISTLELLRCYTKMLSFYMDLRYEDAISVLDGFKGFPSDDKASGHERRLSEQLVQLKTRLDQLPRVKNPLLQSVEEILTDRFTRKPDSKAILFVRTKKHASSMCEWITSLPDHLGIKPQVVTGHTRETGLGMTQIQQQQAIKDFHEKECNVLVATSVAEEGLDVPACNLVLRFQHVSNEIAKVQTRGRARAADSEGFTILSSDTKKTFQELKNGELEVLVEKILASDGGGFYFPTGQYLTKAVLEKQQKVIRERAFKKQIAMSQGQKRKKTQSSDTLQLKCKRCKVLACNGTDIYTLEKATQYVVPDKSFEQRISIQPQKSPKRITESMTITNTVSCANCDNEWGVMCTWPAAGYNLPILKCKSFNFEVDGKLVPVRKWSEAPFEVPPLSSHPDFQTPPGTESGDSSD